MTDNILQQPSSVEFGSFKLTSKPLALFKNGHPIKLQMQPLKLLELLVAHRGALVTHEEIRAQLWDDRTVDFNRSIHVYIRQIRTVLDDDAVSPQFVENIPRQGYRFLAATKPNSTRSSTSVSGQNYQAFWSKRPISIAVSGLVFSIIIASATLLVSGAIFNPTIMADNGDIAAARDSYQRGMYLLEKRTPEATKKSLQYFNAALATDPGLAEAHSSAARALGRMQRFEDANRRAGTALKINDRLPDAYLVLGLIDLAHDWDWDAAKLNLHKALEYDPENANAHQGIAIYYALNGDLETALMHMGLARTLDPASTIIRADFGWFYHFAGEYEKAATICREALDLETTNLEHRYCVVRSQSLAGAHASAIDHMIAYLHESGAGDVEINTLISEAPAKRLLKFDQWRLRVTEDSLLSPARQAYVAAAAHNFDRALTRAQQAYQQRDPMTPFIVVDPVFKPLATEHRFQELIRKLGLEQSTTDS